MRRIRRSHESDLRLAAIEPYNGQPHRPPNRSVKILVEDVVEFASRHGYSIHGHDEVAAMDARFGCGQIFHYVHYDQSTTVVWLSPHQRAVEKRFRSCRRSSAETRPVPGNNNRVPKTASTAKKQRATSEEDWRELMLSSFGWLAEALDHLAPEQSRHGPARSGSRPAVLTHCERGRERTSDRSRRPSLRS